MPPCLRKQLRLRQAAAITALCSAGHRICLHTAATDCGSSSLKEEVHPDYFLVNAALEQQVLHAEPPSHRGLRPCRTFKRRTTASSAVHDQIDRLILSEAVKANPRGTL